jgi:hypothetical protein
MAMLAAASLLGACASDPPDEAATGEIHMLAQVDAVGVTLSGATATITVKGMAPTPGYTHLTLRPVNYIAAPQDGIYDFTAVGTRPTGVVPFHTEPVTFTYRWTKVGADAKGVRIHANDSAVEARIAGR